MWVRLDLQSSYQRGSSLVFQTDERWISLLPSHGSRGNVIIVLKLENVTRRCSAKPLDSARQTSYDFKDVKKQR